MKLSFYLFLMVIVSSIAVTPVLADSNATGGELVDSETVSLGAGPFSHGADVGSSDNTILSGVTFTGGFNATHIRFTGTLTSVISTTWASEADIQIRQASLGSFDWGNPGPESTYTAFDYDSLQELTDSLGGGIDPGVGPWEVEFFDTFDETGEPGTDSASTNVEMTFEQRVPFSDSNGTFSLGSLNVDDTNNSLGELAIPGLYDLYTITLNEEGLFTLLTDADPTGFTGTDADTEIAIFDSNGILVAENDDLFPGSGNLFSGIVDFRLAAGDYTLAVAAFNSFFADDFDVDPGEGTGDYVVSASLRAIPEPGALALLGFGCVGLLACRRRK